MLGDATGGGSEGLFEPEHVPVEPEASLDVAGVLRCPAGHEPTPSPRRFMRRWGPVADARLTVSVRR